MYTRQNSSTNHDTDDKKLCLAVHSKKKKDVKMMKGQKYEESQQQQEMQPNVYICEMRDLLITHTQNK